MRGEGRVFQRGKIWWIAYWGPQDGRWKEIRESSKSEKESDAAKLLRDRVRAIANHRGGIRAFQGPMQEKLTVADLLDSLQADYRRRQIKSLRTTLIHMKPVREFFGHMRAVALTPDVVRQFTEERQTKKLSNAKINRELEILSAAFGLAVREERLARKPYIPQLTEDNARQGFFEADEHELMLKHLPQPMDDIARFGYISGWRRDEICSLQWATVDRAAKEVRIYDSKNGEGRVLPLDDDGWALFERLWEQREYLTASGPALSEYVFHASGKPVGDSNFTHRWQRARAKAKLPGKIFHDYRRTAVRNMIRAGVPQSVAMAITGHRTDSMFRRYNITTSDDKREALRRQSEYLKAQPATSNVAEFRAAGSGSTGADSDVSRTKSE